MEKILEILIKKYGVELCSRDYNYIHTKGDLIICLICGPQEHDYVYKNNPKWLVRFSTVSAFDRWANSTAIEKFFDTMDEVIEYLTNNELDIYKELLSYLSEEYEEYKEAVRADKDED